MKNLFLSIAIIAVLSVAVSSCTKNKCTAGSGGTLTIVAFPKHHGADTKPLWAFVKFNTKDFPGTNPASYDLQIAGDTTENHIELENLKCGDYYIYEMAIDPAINDTVVGGVPFSTEETSGEVNVNVAVTE
jgi:hypothetical protein